MHQQEIVSNNNTDESESNTQSDLIASENINETTSLTSPITNDDEQKLIENPIPISTTLPTVQLQQQDNLINLSGWNVVASWRNENFQMNEHQRGYLENMFASEIIPRVYLGT
jgi:hypothetical protein